MASRMRTTLTAISLHCSSNTVPDFVTRPHKRKSVNMVTLLSFVSAAGHEFVATRPDIGQASFGDDEQLKDFFRLLSEKTGKSLTAISTNAGVSLAVVTWVHGSSGARTVQLDVVLRILVAEGVTLRLRKKVDKRTAQRALLAGA